MPEAYDITLAGQGYTVLPKAYKRGLDSAGSIGASPLRQVQRDWAGALRPGALEKDRHYASLAMVPVRGGGGAGVQLGPRTTTIPLIGFNAAAKLWSVFAQGQPFAALGGKLWRFDRIGSGGSPNNLSGATQLGATLAQTITGLCWDGMNRLFASRQGAGYVVWTIGGAAWDTTPVTQAQTLTWFRSSLWGGYLDPAGWRWARLTSSTVTDPQPLDGPPLAAIVSRDATYVTTGSSLYRLTAGSSGFVWEVLSSYSGAGLGDDGTVLCEWRGQVYSWIGGEVCRYHSGGNSPAQWVGLGLSGVACQGLFVANGMLFAAVNDSPLVYGIGLWMFDGVGWWCVDRSFGNRDYNYPFSSGGYFTNAHIITHCGGTNNLAAFQLAPQTNQLGFASSGELITSLWHGRNPDEEALYTRAGMELGWPGVVGTTPTYTVYLDYSLDGAGTWTNIASDTFTNDAPHTITGPLNVRTKALNLRVRFAVTGSGGFSPVLRAVWSEGRSIEQATHRTAWDMTLTARDEGIRRDGGRDSRSGAQASADLWAAFLAGGTVTFRDVDYDRAPVERTVRIATLTEEIPQPGEAGRWGESRLRVRLVEA